MREERNTFLRKAIMAVLIICFSACFLFADTIYKKNGEKIEGTVTVTDYEGQVGVKTANKMFYIRQSDIERIEYSVKSKAQNGPDWIAIIGITVLSLLAFMLVMAGRSI
jgi:hypothetical protein